MSLELLRTMRDTINEALALCDENDRLAKALTTEQAANAMLTAQAGSAQVTIDQLRAEVERLKALVAPVPVPVVVQRRAAFEVDPAFSRESLSAERRVWHDRLLAAFKSPYPDPRIAARSGTPDAVGFTVKSHIAALAWALDATGDPAILDEIVSIMNVLRERAVFVISLDKDRAFVASLYALTAYVLHINKHSDAAYWCDRTLALCAKGVPSDNLMHPYAASLETAWYMALLTGEERFLADAETKRAELRKSITITEDGRATWYHRPFSWRGMQGDTDNPRTTYMRYVVESLALLDRLGMNVARMTAIAQAVLRVVRDDSTLAYSMDGNGNDQPKFAASNWGMVARADATGELARRLGKAAGVNQVYIPAALVGV